MLKENLIMLRTIHGFSQEEIAGKINISRQAYAKWESGATIPDIQKCALALPSSAGIFTLASYLWIVATSSLTRKD